MSKSKLSEEKLEELRGQLGQCLEEVEGLKKQLLRGCGWEYVCNTPGSFWLWKKTLDDGRTVLVSTDTALSMEGF